MKKHNQGFTLVEVIVAVGILAIIAGVATTFLSKSTSDIKKLERAIEAETESAISERIMARDLKSSEPSFNNIIITDDAGELFFEYATDAVNRAELENTKRTLTLDGKSKIHFSFLNSNEAVGGAIIYDPVMAYDVGAEPAGFDEEATLSFDSLNKDNYLQAQNPAFWIAGQLLMLDTPVGIRSIVKGIPDYKKAARSPVFIGAVEDSKKTLTKLSISGFIDDTHPWYADKKMNSEDIFLRSVPPVGGGVALVRIKVVRALRYSLVPSKTGAFNLIRTTWIGSKWGSENTIATQVVKVVISRKAVNDPIIYFKIYHVSDKK